MDKFNCYPHHDHCHIDGAIIDQLWDRINSKFATNKQVIDLAAELKRVEMGINVQTQHVANAAAAMVMKALQDDLAKIKGGIEIVPVTDKDGRPVIAEENIRTDIIYLTPSQIPDEVDSSLWDEWVAIPVKHCVGTKPTYGRKYAWERIGNKKVDLSWVKGNFNDVNKAIKELNKKLENTSKALAKAILTKAVEPIKELRAYIHSPEYISFVFEKLPRAALGTDGLMSSNQFAILSMLAVWAANDHKVMGGGALGPDVIIHMLDKVGIPTDDLKKKYQHVCGICIDDVLGD